MFNRFICILFIMNIKICKFLRYFYITALILLAMCFLFYTTACNRDDNPRPSEFSVIENSDIISQEKPADKQIGDFIPGKGFLVWADEFSGTDLDSEKWNIETGTGSQYGLNRWGNNELQYYQAENVSVKNGILIIEAKKQTVGSSRYTSARITTGQIRNGTGSPWIIEKYSVKTGRVEARIKSSKGRGFWPAFWLLGSNSYGAIQSRTSVISRQSWPRCGEIDILEFTGGREHDLVQTLHYGNHWQEGQGLYSTWMNWVWPHPNYYRLSGSCNYNWADNWHVYGVVWDETGLQFYVDYPDTGDVIITQTILWDSLPAQSRDFTDAFYNEAGFSIILNLAVGGSMGGGNPLDTSFTDGTGNNTLQVDWVRVYQP